MTPPPNRWNVLLLLPAVLALAVAGSVIATWAGRLTYPFDLEWMEGGVLAHAWRVQHGLPLYQPPSPDFVPMVYPPGYYYLVAALGLPFGISPALGRAVSVLGTLGASGALVWLGARRYGNPLFGLLGAGIFLGCYENSGAFYDLVRPDALSLGLLAWALVLATEPGRRAEVGAGLLLCLAFVTKHNAAAYGLPMALGLWSWRGTGSALRFGLAAAVPAGLYVLVMQILTDGGFLGYLWDVPASHPTVLARLVPGTVRETGDALAVVCAALAAWQLTLGPRVAPSLPVPGQVVPGVLGAGLAVWLVGSMPEVQGIPPAEPWERVAAAMLLGVVAVAVPTSLVASATARRFHGPWIYGAGVVVFAFVTAGLMRAHHGGFMNVFMPLHWVLAAAFVVLLGDLAVQLEGPRASVLASAVALGQLGTQWSGLDLERLVPDALDEAAGWRVVEALKDRPGPVLSPFAPWIPVLAGHEPGFHLIALWDVRHDDGPYKEAGADVLRAIAQRHWPTVLDAPESMGFGLAKAYVKDEVVPLSGRELMPRTGWRRRPGVIWVPGKGPPGRTTHDAAGNIGPESP